MNFSFVHQASKADPAQRGQPRLLVWRRSWLPHAGMIAALLAFTAIAVGSFHSIGALEEQARLVDHTHQVLATLDAVYADLKDAQSAARIYVVSGAPKLLEEFTFYTTGIARSLSELRVQVDDNPLQIRNISVLKDLIDKHLSFLENGIALYQAGRDGAALSYLSGEEGLRSVDNVRAEIAIMRELEGRLLAVRSRAVGERTWDTKLLIVFGSLGAYLMIGGAYLMLRGETLRRLRADQALLDANDALHRHTAQLEASNKELESFSYSISHDLRIPLRAVAGYTRMLEEDYAGCLDGEGRRLLGVIADNSKRMNELIDDLLAFSRLGRKEIVATEVDMTALAQSVADELRATAASTQAAQVTIEPMPPAWGDRSLLRQVWANLISNALKYSATRDRPQVRIDAEEAGKDVVYRVEDNGVGFDMRYAGKLFGVFQRLHGADEFPGTGVGLAIVQRIVARHGGRVWARGEPGKGATFCFSLPRRSGHA